MRSQRDRIYAFLFVLPAVALLTFFSVIPLGRVFYYSFTRWDGLSAPRWIGLGNYRYLWHSDDFHQVVLTTLLLVCGIVVWVVLPFTLSILIRDLRFAGLARAIFFIPILLPPIVSAGVFRIVLGTQGPLNSLLRACGLSFLAAGWITDDKLVLISVVGVIAWAVMGSGVLFYSAGIAALPKSYFEAADIDGARWWQLVWFIYRPALRPVTRFWTLLLTIGTVTYFFPWIFGLTHGGPGIASTTIDYQVYTSGVVSGQWGLSSAMAVVAIVLIAILLVTQLVARKVRADA